MNDFREFLKISIFSNYWITDSLDLGVLIGYYRVDCITYYILLFIGVFLRWRPFPMTDSRTTVLCLTFLVLFISTRILKLVRGLKVRFSFVFILGIMNLSSLKYNLTILQFPCLVCQPSPWHQVSPMSSWCSGRTASYYIVESRVDVDVALAFF